MLQYVLLKIVLTIVSFVLESMGLFGEGEFTPSRGWVYISGITNLSQMWAMYCLVRFYTVCAGDLKRVRPIGKLLAVKSVVFFTYSQSCVIMALVWFDFLPQAIEEGGEHWSTEDVGRGLQDYLICIEMLVAAIVFSHVFSHHDYRDGAFEELPLTDSGEYGWDDYNHKPESGHGSSLAGQESPLVMRSGHGSHRQQALMHGSSPKAKVQKARPMSFDLASLTPPVSPPP